MRGIIAILLFCCAPALAGDLQALIDAAPPGATLDVPAGVYAPIKTDKPVRLIGHDWPVIDGAGMTDCVTLAGAGSEISGFVVRNSGDDLDQESTGLRVLGARTIIQNNRFENVLFGIDLKNASDCVIRGNYIGSKPLDIARRGDALRLFRSDRCLIESNTIEDGRDALLWYSNKVTVRKNASRRNRYGFHMMYANEVTLEDNDIENNSVGIYVMYGRNFSIARNRLIRNRGPSGYALGLKEIDAYTIRDNLMVGNRVGIYIDGSPLTRKPGKAWITGNAIAGNDIGVSMLPAVKGNRIAGNNFIDNIEQLAVLGRGAVTGNEFAIEGRGNFWSDYAGFDADHDGIGDQEYASRKLFESLIDHEPKLRLMLFSPAHEAIEFIGRALPAVRPEPKFTDPRPLAKPASIAFPAPAPRSGHSIFCAAIILLLIAGAVFCTAFAAPWRRRRRPSPVAGVDKSVILTGVSS